MKRKEIIHLLLIAVAMMMFTACASSRRVVSDNHQETKDSVKTEQQDSVHKQVAVSDSAARKLIEDKQITATPRNRANMKKPSRNISPRLPILPATGRRLSTALPTAKAATTTSHPTMSVCSASSRR